MKSFVASAFVAGMAAAAGAGEWDYLQNGRNWGDICANGVSQSPINFDRRKEEKTHDTVLEVEGYASQNNLQVNVGALPGTASRGQTQYYGYSAIKVDLVSSAKAGHDNISSGTPTMRLRHPGEENAQLWTALQYHFHAPSEHTVNGHAYDAEVHFVHTYTLEGFTPLAVLGVFFQESDCAAIALYDDDVAEGEQPLYLEFETTEAKAKCFEDRLASDNFFEAMYPEVVDHGIDTEITNVPIQEFINSLSLNNFWTYKGSLTTPPCTEGVNWTSLQEVAPISPEHLQKMKDLYEDNTSFAPCSNGACNGGNNRMVQPLGNRVLYFNDSGAIQVAASALVLGVMSALAAY